MRKLNFAMRRYANFVKFPARAAFDFGVAFVSPFGPPRAL
jgi:hypothetical protein